MYIGINKYYVKRNMLKSKMLTLLVCFEQLVTNVSCICRYLHVSVLLLPEPCRRNGQTIVHRGHRTQERGEVGWPLGQARHGAPYESRLLVDLTDSFQNVFLWGFFFYKTHSRNIFIHQTCEKKCVLVVGLLQWPKTTFMLQTYTYLWII